jgi:hypothetical protein
MSHNALPKPPAKLPLKMTLLWVFLFIGLLALGYYGWMETLKKAVGEVHHPEVLLHTSELITGEVAVVVNEIHSQHWTLIVAKWGIKLLLAAAIFQSAVYFFRRRLRRWKFRWVSGHRVFLGLDSTNEQLVARVLVKGQRVAIVDSNEHHPGRADLESRGVLFLCGSPLDSDLLCGAGVARASQIIVGTGSDETNVATAEKVASILKPQTEPPVEILVPIENRRMRGLLRERWALLSHARGFHIRLIGFRPVALRNALSKSAEVLTKSPEFSKVGPRILVAADPDFAMEFLDLAVPFLQISGSALPSYDVCGVGPVDARSFVRSHADIQLVANVTFHEGIADDAALAEGLAGKEFDLAIVHLDSEIATLALAESILHCCHFRATRVQALIDNPAVIHLNPEDRMDVISLFTHGISSPEFGDLSLEESAKANHMAYLAGLEPSERAKAPSWDELPEAFKDSNRWAVLHRQVKSTVWKKTAESDKPAVLEMLACSEHQRWMAEKIMAGWRGGPMRDNSRKIHPDILPFADLRDDVKEKDRVQVCKALGLDAVIPQPPSSR